MVLYSFIDYLVAFRRSQRFVSRKTPYADGPKLLFFVENTQWRTDRIECKSAKCLFKVY